MSKKPFGITLNPQLSLDNKTGSWRNKRPVYVKRIPPCNMTCPAGENIQYWLSKVQEGDIRAAWDIIVEDNPFPALMGRVCYHPCQLACNRNHFDSTVNINFIEKYIGDFGIKENWKFHKPSASTGKNVLIFGAGPAGLTAAYFLRKFGHGVTIFEFRSKPGGMLRYGIPSYRLSRDVLDAEINRILDLGVDLHLNKFVNPKDYVSSYDAIFIATGAHVASKVEMKKTGENVYDAVDLLRIIEDEGPGNLNLGNDVVIYGGGNTAIDVARTAIRLGCKHVKIVYRRELENMAAHKSEIEEALSEGVEILCLRSLNSIDCGHVFLEALHIEGENMIPTGKFEQVKADTFVFAIGQSIDSGLFKDIPNILISDKGVIKIDDQMMTGCNGIFAGGDVIPSKRTVTTSIGHGKKAAKCIDAYLNGEKYVSKQKNEVATVKKLNFAYYEKTKGMKRGLHTSDNFNEHGVKLSNEQAIFEAKRCLSCGNCFSCDNCYGFCPDNAIIKDEFGLSINYEYCKGCGICERECPCGAIKMENEEK